MEVKEEKKKLRYPYTPSHWALELAFLHDFFLHGEGFGNDKVCAFVLGVLDVTHPRSIFFMHRVGNTKSVITTPICMQIITNIPGPPKRPAECNGPARRSDPIFL